MFFRTFHTHFFANIIETIRNRLLFSDSVPCQVRASLFPIVYHPNNIFLDTPEKKPSEITFFNFSTHRSENGSKMKTRPDTRRKYTNTSIIYGNFAATLRKSTHTHTHRTIFLFLSFPFFFFVRRLLSPRDPRSSQSRGCVCFALLSIFSTFCDLLLH